MRALTIPEWGDIFSGKKTGRFTTVFRPQPVDVEAWSKALNSAPENRMLLQKTDNYVNFYNTLPDLATIVPKERQVEYFYAWKNGFLAPNCPAAFIFFAKAIFAKYHLCNCIGPLLPKFFAEKVTANNYFGAGYTGRDAICNFVCQNFQPITPSQLIVDCGGWYEAFLPKLGMLVALAPDVGKDLRSEDMEQVDLTPEKGLSLYNKPLCILEGVDGPNDVHRPVSAGNSRVSV